MSILSTFGVDVEEVRVWGFVPVNDDAADVVYMTADAGNAAFKAGTHKMAPGEPKEGKLVGRITISGTTWHVPILEVITEPS